MQTALDSGTCIQEFKRYERCRGGPCLWRGFVQNIEQWLTLPCSARKLRSCLRDLEMLIIQMLWAVRSPSWSALSDLWGPSRWFEWSKLPGRAWFLWGWKIGAITLPPLSSHLLLVFFNTSLGTGNSVSTGPKGHPCHFFAQEEYTWYRNFDKASFV